MQSDVPRLRYILPKFKIRDYGRLMKTLNNSFKFGSEDELLYKLHTLEHFYEYGWRSTCSAFSVGRSTLYEWKKAYEDSDKKLFSLKSKSTRPKRVRVMQVDYRLIECIKALRKKYPNLSKYKLKPFIDAYAKYLGISSIGLSSIGKIIKRKHLYFEPIKLKKKTKYTRGRSRYAPKVNKPGFIEIDSVVIYLSGKKHFFISIIDIFTKYALVKKVSSLSSLQAKLAIEEFQKQYKLSIKIVQSDNGSEFLKHFHQYLQDQNIRHQFIYPRCPKINGVVERFNRTLQEEHLEYSEAFQYNLPRETITNLNKYLHWYNYQRPHASLDYMSPVEFIHKHFPECM